MIGSLKEVFWPAIDRGADSRGGPDVGLTVGRAEANRRSEIFVVVAVALASIVAVFCMLILLRNSPFQGVGMRVMIGLLIVMGCLAGLSALMIVPRLDKIGETFRRRVDSEHEQIFIRVVLSVLVFAYLTWAAKASGFPNGLVSAAVLVFFGHCLSWLFVIHIVLRPHVSTTRRTLCVFADHGFMSGVVALAGEPGVLLFPIFLWVTLGNGLRFGARFLTLAAVVGFIGFYVASSISEYWRAHDFLSYGVLTALIILPSYVMPLIGRLNRARAQAEEANHAKGRFLAMVSHELRTPLTAIIGMGGLLRQTKVDEDQRDMIETVDTSAQSLLCLINEILDFSKIEAGMLALDIEEFEIQDVCAKIWVMLRGQAHHKGLRLRISVQGDASRRVRGDAKRFSQVLINLIGNAIKFTESGTVELSVRLDPRSEMPCEEGSCWFRFEVTDTGIGIPRDKCTGVFEGFAQADDSISRRYGGTGLGLAISKQLVELMGGHIGVVSQFGAGSSFWLSLPFPINETEVARRLDTKGLTVVLVGSDQEVTDFRFLMMAAWQVDPVIVEHLDTLRRMLADDGSMGSAIFVVSDRRSDPLSEFLADYLSERALDTDLTVIEVFAAGDGIAALEPWPVRLTLDASPQKSSLRAALQAAVRIRRPWPLDTALSSVGGDAEMHSERPRMQAGKRILLAEDNGTNRMVITRLLDVAGHEVVPAADGDQALEILAKGRFDLTLMDMNMPVTSGLDVVRVHRMSEKDGRHMPIIALTAEATEDAKQACREAGMDDFLTKPVDPQLLFSMIDHWAPAREEESEMEEASVEQTVTPISLHPRYQTIVEPVIDPASLKALKALDTDGSFFAEVLTEFLTDSKSVLDEIDRSLAANDVRRFADAAHSMRSAGSHVGAIRVVSHLLGLSNITEAEFTKHGEAHIRELHNEFRLVCAALEQELRSEVSSKALQED